MPLRDEASERIDQMRREAQEEEALRLSGHAGKFTPPEGMDDEQRAKWEASLKGEAPGEAEEPGSSFDKRRRPMVASPTYAGLTEEGVSALREAAGPAIDPRTLTHPTPEQLKIVGKEVGLGLIPLIGQERDVGDAVTAIETKDPVMFAMSAVGFAPLFGDFAKGTFKAIRAGDRSADTLNAGRKILDNAADAQKAWWKMGADSPYFKRWNEGSVMNYNQTGLRDPSKPPPLTKAEGDTPVVLYHGTEPYRSSSGGNIISFKPSRTGTGGPGVYLTPDPDLASSYGASGSVYPVYANLKKPLVTNKLPADSDLAKIADDLEAYAKTIGDDPGYRQQLTEAASRYRDKKYLLERMKHQQDVGGMGFYSVMEEIPAYNHVRRELIPKHYDGIILHNPHPGVTTPEVIIFDPKQIKSKFNKGTFDKNNPDITASLAGAFDDPTVMRG